MTAINAAATLTHNNGVAILTLDSPPVNALSQTVREGLLKGVEAAAADAAAKAIVLICKGRTFIAGADISEFGKPPQGPSLRAVQDAMENAPKPIIAAIHGTALGGGLEVALVCHYRVAVPSARCGLPEVRLGLLPGAGGTQRLPRIVGVEQALRMVTSGEHVPAKAAAAMGLIDAIVPEDGLLDAACDFARKAVGENRPLVKIRDRSKNVTAARGKPEIFADFRKSIARRTRGFLAPEYNIRCIEAAVNLPFDEGLKKEAEMFRELVTGVQSAAQRHVFFAERRANKIPDIPPDTPTLPIARAGIIGGGTMGGGIAMNFANAGIPVTIVEQNSDRLNKGLDIIRRNYDNTRKRGRISEDDVKRRMELITGGLALDTLADADLIIEAVFENMDIKKDIFRALDAIAKPDAILATNTSALDINAIAAVTGRPQSVLGLHFFSPANVMRLLEVVRAEKTAKPAIATCMKLARTIGKVAALVGVCPGFVGNRILAQRQREANKIILEGAMPWDVDRVLYDFGFPMGPFAMSDLAGLDIGWSRETSRGETLRDALCEAGRFGQKSGAGFYTYDEARRPTPDPKVEDIIRAFSEKSQIQRRTVSDDEILERCIYPMINEGAKILEEGMAIRASDIDVIWVYGYGWPIYRGGPMFHADTLGLDRVIGKLKEMEQRYGEAWRPAPLLEKTAAEGRRLQDV